MLTDLIDDATGSPGVAGCRLLDEPAYDAAALLLDLLVEWGVVEPAGGSRRAEPPPSHFTFPAARPKLIDGLKPA